jgi:hypothetical protein
MKFFVEIYMADLGGPPNERDVAEIDGNGAETVSMTYINGSDANSTFRPADRWKWS